MHTYTVCVYACMHTHGADAGVWCQIVFFFGKISIQKTYDLTTPFHRCALAAQGLGADSGGLGFRV